MARLLKWTGIVLGALLLLVIAAGVAFMLIVDEEMIAGRMEVALQRHVTIDALNVGIFSALSGIEVDGVRVSNHKKPEELAALRDKPVPDRDLFAGLEAFRLKFRLLPLLRGSVEIRELVLQAPTVNVVRRRDGTFNFSDLLERTPTESKPSPGEDVRPDTAEAAGGRRPLSADDLPVRLQLGKLGIEDGTLTYRDARTGLGLEVYALDALVHSAEIDPAHLEEKNIVRIRMELGVRPTGRLPSDAVRTFDIGLGAEGSVKPFDVETRLLNPEVALRVGSPRGKLTGLRIFEAIQRVQALEPYTGRLDFLRDEVAWEDAELDLWYRDGTVKFSNGRIVTNDFDLDFSGATHTQRKTVDLDVGMVLAAGHTQAIRAEIEQNMRKQLKGDVARFLPPEKVAAVVMKRLTNDQGRIALGFHVGGTVGAPRAKLVRPELPPANQLVREMSHDLQDVAREAAKQEAQKAVEGLADKLMRQLGQKTKE